MKQTSIGGTKRKVANGLAMAGMLIIFIAYMFPFIMVVINSLKEKRDIIKSLSPGCLPSRVCPLTTLSALLPRWIS